MPFSLVVGKVERVYIHGSFFLGADKPGPGCKKEGFSPRTMTQYSEGSCGGGDGLGLDTWGLYAVKQGDHDLGLKMVHDAGARMLVLLVVEGMDVGEDD